MDPQLFEKAAEMVKTCITGHRKGLPDQPTYLHSIRVSQQLRDHGFSDEVCLGGLLHDIIEDGGKTPDDLRALGVPENALTLIQLATHNTDIVDRDLRWVLMVAELVKADNADAWAIKLADVFDNVKDSHAMKPERGRFMRRVKLPAMLHLSKKQIGETSLWKLVHEYYEALPASEDSMEQP